MQVRFIFALHNHQPVGNFSHVFEQTYQESYLPFLDVFEQYPQVKVALHLSGSLIEWLSENHSEYLDRLALLVERHRIEIIGGAFFEPILAMLPSRDRIGQIRLYTDWLERRLGAKIRGLWIPERVWEQSYVRDLVDAGMNYTILDDCHFRSAGLTENELTRHYLTEDDGRTMSVFPGSERLRYLIPFGNVDETIRHIAEIGERVNNAVVVHADDGEKFGTWPQTHSHVYNDKWLHHFFDALSENSGWLITTTPSEAIIDLEPLGKIYIPDGSYREMTEWVLRSDQQNELHNITNKIQNHSELYPAKKFLRGGFWRNFKLRYPESDEMYSRMMSVSMRLETLSAQGFEGYKIDTARELLYRGQCNCSYWHGAFGGIYLQIGRAHV
jgi:alpha-amylase